MSRCVLSETIEMIQGSLQHILNISMEQVLRETIYKSITAFKMSSQCIHFLPLKVILGVNSYQETCLSDRENGRVCSFVHSYLLEQW